MKYYGDYPKASISMSKDELFIRTINDLFKNNPIEYIFESGTFIGTGSTITLAEAILRNNVAVKKFITVEVDYSSYKKAKKNLAAYPFVTSVWGMSVGATEAKTFVENDEAIKNHERYPDIFIDNVEDPIGFYTNELSGQLSKTWTRESKLQKFLSIFKNPPQGFEDNLMKKYLTEMRNHKPLILLDSAGGVGWLEFNTVLDLMNNKPYFLVLDDIHHLKHFRSYDYVRNNSSFTILNGSVEYGWVVAEKK